MELHLHAVDLLHGIHHILNELGIGGSCRMDANHHLGFLGFLLVGPLGLHLLAIGIDSLLADLVSCCDWCHQQLIQTGSETLS